jgi:type IV/VI secretion system ImpK/VasF family protein
MASTSALWFHIETAFAEVDDLCVAARAADLVLKQKEQEAKLLRTFGRQSRMDDDDAPAVIDPRLARATELAKDLAFREANPNGADLVEIRARLRKRLTWLKSKLSEALSDHEVYYALFPIVVYTDELIRSVSRGHADRWEPLQSELYNVDNGGELFYSILDDRLRQEETAPVVFEIFFFCLSDGFLGMYQGDQKKLDEYKARLAEKIPVKPAGNGDAAETEAPAVELVTFPWFYYAGAVAIIVSGYLLLSAIGSAG